MRDSGGDIFRNRRATILRVSGIKYARFRKTVSHPAVSILGYPGELRATRASNSIPAMPDHPPKVENVKKLGRRALHRPGDLANLHGMAKVNLPQTGWLGNCNIGIAAAAALVEIAFFALVPVLIRNRFGGEINNKNVFAGQQSADGAAGRNCYELQE